MRQWDLNPGSHDQGCSYGGRRRAGPPSTHDFRPAQPKKKRFPPGTMLHNRGSIIAQYTYVIYIENDLVRLWNPAGALPLDSRSLALRFFGFTHSACHYYAQLFSTTQIGLATTLLMMRVQWTHQYTTVWHLHCWSFPEVNFPNWGIFDVHLHVHQFCVISESLIVK